MRKILIIAMCIAFAMPVFAQAANETSGDESKPYRDADRGWQKIL